MVQNQDSWSSPASSLVAAAPDISVAPTIITTFAFTGSCFTPPPPHGTLLSPEAIQRSCNAFSKAGPLTILVKNRVNDNGIGYCQVNELLSANYSLSLVVPANWCYLIYIQTSFCDMLFDINIFKYVHIVCICIYEYVFIYIYVCMCYCSDILNLACWKRHAVRPSSGHRRPRQPCNIHGFNDSHPGVKHWYFKCSKNGKVFDFLIFYLLQDDRKIIWLSQLRLLSIHLLDDSSLFDSRFPSE